MLSKEEILLNVAFSEIGTAYKWGGDDFSGRDCSGFIYYLYESIGILTYGGDLTAHGLVEFFEEFVDETSTDDAKCGDIVYWYNSDETKVVHIEMCIGNGLCIGASGGGSRTKTEADAIRDNAYVRVRSIDARAGAYVLNVSDLI